MEVEKLLSIITINYNGLKDTCELIDTLPLHDETIEVIVVDNASTQDEATEIEKRYQQVKVIKSDKNLGFAGGNNLGIQTAHGKYLFFINNDAILPQPSAISLLINRLASSDQIGMVCPKIKFSWGDHRIQYASYTPLSKITLRNKSIGFGEELDWSMMIRRAGYEIWYEPACTIFHKESQTTGQQSPLKTYYITRNRFHFALRNINRGERYLTYIYLICIVAVRDILKYLYKGQINMAKAVMKGIIDFFKL